LLGGRDPLLRQLETQTGRRFFVQVAADSVPLEHVAVIPD
jgi:hypothetical protein